MIRLAGLGHFYGWHKGDIEALTAREMVLWWSGAARFNEKVKQETNRGG